MHTSNKSANNESRVEDGHLLNVRSEGPKSPAIRAYMMDIWSFIPYYTGQLCSSLKRQSVDVILGSSRYHLDRDYFSKVGLTPDPLLLDRGGGVQAVRFRRLVKAFEYMANLMILSLRFAVARPHLVHVQYLPFLERGFRFELWFLKWIRLLGIRVVYTVHNVTAQNTPNSYRDCYRSAYSLADALICHGNEARSQLIQEFSIPVEKIWIIPHGPLYGDKPAIAQEEAKRALGLKVDETLVLCLGVISEYKGIPFLLDVWKRAMELGARSRLLIAGTGEECLLSSIRQSVLANKIQDSVDLRLRFIGVDELPIFHQAADILVYPYIAGTTSGALLTGMNYQKAVIATTLPFFREYLRHEQEAVLVPYGDRDGWARTLVDLLHDKDKRERLGKSIETRRLADVSWTDIALETSKCYRAVCDCALLSETKSESLLSDRPTP